MANRKQRRAMERKQNQGLDALKKIGESMAAKRQDRNQSGPNVPSQDAGTMTVLKPHAQDLGDVVIQWTWRHELFDVTARYYRKEPNVDGFKAGDYRINICPNSTSEDILNDHMSVTEANDLAIALKSAVEWRRLWQQHMGEFFTAKAIVKPPLKVVEDEIEDADDNDIDDEGYLNGPE